MVKCNDIHKQVRKRTSGGLALLLSLDFSVRKHFPKKQYRVR